MTATTIDQITGFSGSLAVKQPVRLATTAPIVLEGLFAIDGVVPAEGDRILVKDQADASQNGIYIASSGVWERAADLDATGKVVKGTQVWVTDGASQPGNLWIVDAENPITLGATLLTWQIGSIYQAAASMAVAISGAANKATPAAADQFGYVNQADGTLRQFSWTQMLAALTTGLALANYLPLAGGTLTGNLAIGKATPALTLNAAAAGQQALINFLTAGASRWAFYKDSISESGADAGSDLVFGSYADAGTFKENVLSMSRAGGVVSLLKGQLKFPATANPSSDPNTLDDYEEGTWTPTMTFGGSSTGVTYGTQDGRYVKIGSMVWLGIRVTLTNNGSGTGQCVITSLPFTSLNAGAAALGCFMAEYWVGTTGVVGNLLAIIGSNSTSAGMRMSSGTNTVDVSDTVIGNTATVYLDGWYRAAA